MVLQTSVIKNEHFEIMSLFGHDFYEFDECINCEICCPGSCTGCTQCNQCNLSYAHGKKSEKYFKDKK